MATVGASLKLFDQFSNTLNLAQQSMNSTIIIADRLRHSLHGTIELRFVIDSNMTLNQAAQIRSRIESRFGEIRARIRVDLPVHVTAMFTNLQVLVMRLIGAVRQLRIVSGSNAQSLQDALQRIARLEQQIIDLQTRLNERIRDGGNRSGSLLSNLKGIAATYLSIAAARKLWDATVGGAMEQQKMQDMFKARTGDDQVGAAMFQKFKTEALKAGMDVKESLKGTLSFFSVTQNTDQLSKLNNLAQRLNAFDSAGNGMEGAAFALKEALSGDIVSLAERFNMSKVDIRKFKIDDLGKSGNVDGFLKAFDQLLEKQKMGQAAFDKILASPAKQSEILKNNLKSGLADAGQGAVAALLPLILMLNQSFQDGRFQSFFSGLQTGLRIVAMLIVGATHGVLWFADAVQNHWPIISSILASIGTLLAMVLIPRLWGMIAPLWAAIPPLYAQAAAWLAINWPIVLISAAIGLLIFILQKCGVTVDQVVGVIAGTFMMLVGVIWNQVALIWNIFASFAEFLINLFIDPVYATKKLFYDLATTFGSYMLNMIRSTEDFAGSFMKTILQGINKALEGFNWLTSKVNDIFGTDFKQAKLFDETNVHAVSDSMKKVMDMLEKPVSEKSVVSIARMDEKNLKNEFDFGYKKGSDFINSLSFSMPGADMSAIGNWDTINRVNEVGSINDTVDISNEDLKVMRELAEMKSIQNFITLTPTVQLTGDIHNHEAGDVEDMVGQLVESLRTQMAVSVDGVISP